MYLKLYLALLPAGSNNYYSMQKIMLNVHNIKMNKKYLLIKYNGLNLKKFSIFVQHIKNSTNIS